jgi:hypothetical protein
VQHHKRSLRYEKLFLHNAALFFCAGFTRQASFWPSDALAEEITNILVTLGLEDPTSVVTVHTKECAAASAGVFCAVCGVSLVPRSMSVTCSTLDSCTGAS